MLAYATPIALELVPLPNQIVESNVPETTNENGASESAPNLEAEQQVPVEALETVIEPPAPTKPYFTTAFSIELPNGTSADFHRIEPGTFYLGTESD